jgi:hypothetical protein
LADRYLTIFGNLKESGGGDGNPKSCMVAAASAQPNPEKKKKWMLDVLMGHVF